MSDEAMEVDAVLDRMNDALTLQLRSVLHYTVAAASIGGLAYVGLVDRWWDYAEEELRDARRMVEKIVALGGEPRTEVPEIPFSTDATEATEALVACEREVIAALHKVIPKTGQEPRSEALEHLVEHVICRKQEQVDQLARALGQQA
jgi:bacterioferritin (cytochrome b1)